MIEETTEIRYLTYARTATSGEHDLPTPIEAQQTAMRLYVAENGGTIVGEYADTGANGFRFDHPGFQSLLAHLSLADAEVVLTTTPCRLGRGETYSEAVSEIKSSGGRVESVSEQVGAFGNRSFDFMLAFTQVMDEYLREGLKEKMKAKRAQMVARGHYVGGKVPFGFRTETVLEDSPRYKKPPKRLVLDDHGAAIVRQAYDLLLKSQSFEAVAEFLKTQSPKIATRRQTHRLLTNPVYSRIVGDDVFQAVQRVMAEKIVWGTR